MSPFDIALEHAIWARARGMTPPEVLRSIGVIKGHARWGCVINAMMSIATAKYEANQ